MWMRRLGLCFACLTFVVGVLAHVVGRGDSDATKNAAKSKGREYHVHLTLYETDKNGRRKVFGNPTISTPEGEEFKLLSGGEFPFLVDRKVEWAQLGVSAHGNVRRLLGDRVNVDASIEIRQKTTDPADSAATTIVGQSVRTIRNVKLGELVHVALNDEATRSLDMRITLDSGPQTAKGRKAGDGDSERPSR
jgi:hypothetical protein